MSLRFYKLVMKYARDAGYGNAESAANAVHIDYSRLNNPYRLSVSEIIRIRDSFKIPDWKIERIIREMLENGNLENDH